jgi:hypothetical protein
MTYNNCIGSNVYYIYIQRAIHQANATPIFLFNDKFVQIFILVIFKNTLKSFFQIVKIYLRTILWQYKFLLSNENFLFFLLEILWEIIFL